MPYAKIMVPFDGSVHSKEALAYAKGLLALAPEAKLVVTRAVPVGTPATGGDMSGSLLRGQFSYEQYRAIVDQMLATAKGEVLDELGDALDDVKERSGVEVVMGVNVADALVRYACEQGVDLIVMGRRGLGAIRGMIGSVSYALLREAEIPVLTVK